MQKESGENTTCAASLWRLASKIVHSEVHREGQLLCIVEGGCQDKRSSDQQVLCSLVALAAPNGSSGNVTDAKSWDVTLPTATTTLEAGTSLASAEPAPDPYRRVWTFAWGPGFDRRTHRLEQPPSPSPIFSCTVPWWSLNWSSCADILVWTNVPASARCTPAAIEHC